jgi:steroid 5-alpha reductase family enzyme
MTAITSIVVASLIMSAMMAAAWSVQRATHQSGWADVFWSFAIGLGGLVVVGQGPEKRVHHRVLLVLQARNGVTGVANETRIVQEHASLAIGAGSHRN